MTNTLTPKQLVALAMANPGKPVADDITGDRIYWDDDRGLRTKWMDDGNREDASKIFTNWTMLNDPTLWRPWPEWLLPRDSPIEVLWRGDEEKSSIGGVVHRSDRLIGYHDGRVAAWRPAQGKENNDT